VAGSGAVERFEGAVAAGIETAVLHPPNHRETAVAAFAASLPTTERISSGHMSLPLFAGISDAQIEHVITRIASHRHRRDLPA
jgi:dTDP-4-amino-4,6-dideoxygalactose transaminase